jgi:stalled ribosome rescue protein Dom34
MASLAVKNTEIQHEMETEKKALMAENATDAEMRAVNKVESYQNADKSIQDTSIADETDTMKQFFKRSNIYKKYE